MTKSWIAKKFVDLNHSIRENMIIPVYSLPWHLHHSSSSSDILISPLSPYLKFKQIGWDGGESSLPLFENSFKRKNPIIFYQSPPPKYILSQPDMQIIWIPMWDQACAYDMQWWNNLPKNLRVVSFSNEISIRARAVGLRTMELRYFISPDDCSQANWSKTRTLFYWNRVGIIGEPFLRKLCSVLEIDTLYFRRRIDPNRPLWCDYGMPDKIGKTRVIELNFNHQSPDAQKEYLKYLDNSNIFIAPRPLEGVGLSFIEALARGCAVLANNTPTMNEYITHKKNGYLLDNFYSSLSNVAQRQIKKQYSRISNHLGSKFFLPEYTISEWQNWAEIKSLDLQKLGNMARQNQIEGYKTWKNCLPQFASFIMDW